VDEASRAVSQEIPHLLGGGMGDGGRLRGATGFKESGLQLQLVGEVADQFAEVVDRCRGPVGPESELRAMAPATVGVHAARVPFGAMRAGGAMDPTIPLAPVGSFSDPPHVDATAEMLAAAPVHAIAYGFTSSAYVIGIDGEASMNRPAGAAHAKPSGGRCIGGHTDRPAPTRCGLHRVGQPAVV
jgi:hypothetical protein